MALSTKMSSLIYLALIFNIIFLKNTNMVAAQCQGDFKGLVTKCSKYVQIPGGIENPSPECCDAVKTIDVICVCKNIPDGADKYVSLEKAVYVARYCGKPLAHGTKCGSYTVPKI